MRTRLAISLIAISVLLSVSAVSAKRESREPRDRESLKGIAAYAVRSIDARSYRSPGRLHKVIVSSDDARGLSEAEASGRQIADYGSFKLFAIDEKALEEAEERRGRGAEEQQKVAPFTSAPLPLGSSAAFTVRDDLNVLMLRSGAIDTTAEEAASGFVGVDRAAAALGLQARSSVDDRTGDDSPVALVQFIGPVKREWLAELEASGLEPIAYVPNNGYLVRGDRNARARLASRNRIAQNNGEGFIQWQGPFLDEHKIHPALIERSGEISVAVQLALGSREFNPRENAEVRQAKRMARSVILDSYQVMKFTNLRMKIDASRIAELAALPSVVNIEPWTPPGLLDERSSQIVAGELTADRTAPKGPGYAAWLAAHGFASNFNFAVDVPDTGVDRGATTPDKLHPDFLDSNHQSRLLYARDYTSELDGSDTGGHGTINLSIVGGNNTSAAAGARDSAGYSYGMGVAPFVLLGSSKIFQSSSGAFDLIEPYTKLVSDSYRDGARVSSNSWGSFGNQYTIDSQEYDSRVRDAAPDQAGNQELTICFAAGNSGANQRIVDPGTAKNVISVGAGENTRKDGVDGCNVSDTGADNAMDVANFSSGGPLFDGRMKPDVCAPGSHIVGAASQHPEYDGSFVCGQAFDKPFYPAGQTMYTWSSGTSHSTPQVAGAAALARQYLLNRGENPTAALIKALLLDTTTYMTGSGAGGDLPHPRQGWGLVNLNRTFDSTPRFFVNQTTMLTESGQTMILTGEVKDPTQPFRVMLAWTDAPGFSAAVPWVNDLDLEVTINGQVYQGNNFLGQNSQPGGERDAKNNVEAVWLPAGTVGTFVVRVRAAIIAGDGVPGNLDPTDQDFALVVYNGERKDAAVATISGISLTAGADAFADPGETVSMKITIGDASPVSLTGGRGTLATTTTGVTVTVAGADFPTISPGQSVESASPFAFTIAPSVACGSTIKFVLDVASQGLISRVPFTVRVGRSQPVEFFADDVESGESKWTHASGIKKKKNRVDTWSISTKRVRSGAGSWFSSDPGTKVTDAHLDTVPIQLSADARSLQLVFYHTFEFERGGFDGGVIEISTGGDFEDLGSKIVKGGYNGTMFDFTSNPLAGEPAWVEGRLGAFQQVVVDLSSYAGKTVTIRFRLTTDSTGRGLGWFIDDLSVRGERFSCTSSVAEQ